MCLFGPFWQRCFNRCWKTAVSCPVPGEGPRPHTKSGADIYKDSDPVTKWLLPMITDEFSSNHDIGYTNVWFEAVYKRIPTGEYRREFHKVRPTTLPTEPVALLNLVYVNTMAPNSNVHVVYTKEAFMRTITQNQSRDVYDGPTSVVLLDKQYLVDTIQRSPWKDEILSLTPTSPTKPTYIRTYVRTYVRTYIHTYVHTYIRTYIHTYIRTYIRTYVHTYIRTYIRTISRLDKKAAKGLMWTYYTKSKNYIYKIETSKYIWTYYTDIAKACHRS